MCEISTQNNVLILETGKTAHYVFLYMYSYNPQTRDRGTTADKIYHAEWHFDILHTTST